MQKEEIQITKGTILKIVIGCVVASVWIILI